MKEQDAKTLLATLAGFPWEPEDIVVEKDDDGRFWLAMPADDVIVSMRGKIRHRDGKAVTQEQLRMALVLRCVLTMQGLPHERALAKLQQDVHDWQGMWDIANKRADAAAAELKRLKEAARGNQE